MNFNFSNWHLVPKDATIPAGTPYWHFDRKTMVGVYKGEGTFCDIGPNGRLNVNEDYFTEEPIPAPDEAALEERAQKMFRMFWDSLAYQWEYEYDHMHDKWRRLAAAYVEKETD